MKTDSTSPMPSIEQAEKRPSPWLYIITLYFPFGLLQAGLGVYLPNNLLKLLEFSNEQIGLLSGLGLVASLRFAFAPWLDGATTKRRLSIVTLLLAGCAALVMATLTFAQPDRDVFFWSMVVMLLLVAAIGAAHETAADGYYIRALDLKLQAQFIGVKTASIRIGLITASTGLLLLATSIAERYGAVGMDSIDKTGFYYGFSAAFAVAGVAILLIAG